MNLIFPGPLDAQALRVRSSGSEADDLSDDLEPFPNLA
jgi:hypothetical protein